MKSPTLIHIVLAMILTHGIVCTDARVAADNPDNTAVDDPLVRSVKNLGDIVAIIPWIGPFLRNATDILCNVVGRMDSMTNMSLSNIFKNYLPCTITFDKMFVMDCEGMRKNGGFQAVVEQEFNSLLSRVPLLKLLLQMIPASNMVQQLI